MIPWEGREIDTLQIIISCDKVKLKNVKESTEVNANGPILRGLSTFELEASTVSSPSPNDSYRLRLLTSQNDEASAVSFKIKGLLILSYYEKVSEEANTLFIIVFERIGSYGASG